MAPIEVIGCGQGWALVQAGQVLRHYRDHHTAEACALGLERKQRRASATRRPCMHCAAAFASEGPHNRLCGRCRTL
jgi:hypothetical protein